MDRHKPPSKPAQLLNDLESIRQLLDSNLPEPPLLTDAIDPQSIPLLSEIVTPASADSIMQRMPTPASAHATLPSQGLVDVRERARLERELRLAAQLMLQEVIDEFVPQIEAELKRRLDQRLEQLLLRCKL